MLVLSSFLSLQAEGPCKLTPAQTNSVQGQNTATSAELKAPSQGHRMPLSVQLPLAGSSARRTSTALPICSTFSA